MTVDNIFRRLRGALGNALVWGVGWFTAAFAGFAVLRVAGILPETLSWAQGLGVAIRFGIVGVFAGGAFSSVIRLLYHGRRLSEISWVRFGIGGAVVTGLFVPVFLQTMNLLSGDGLVPWELVLDDGLGTAAFGGVAAAVSLKLAQRAVTVLPGRSQDQLDRLESVDRFASAGERDYPITQRSRSAQR
ncbi:MAG: hypothetical protein Q8R44_12435 [Novosphingobium sp.]|nr:hypothetical protein [Novosphingobium sp.]